MRLLDVPWVVNEEAERISTHGGLATIDFCGTVAERREAMRLVARAQEIAKVLLELHGSLGGHNDEEWHTRDCWQQKQGYQRSPCTVRCVKSATVLRAAGVLP